MGLLDALARALKLRPAWLTDEWARMTLWALDLETGGLDARRDPIMAVGMAPIRGGVLRLGESFRTLVEAEGASVRPESVRAHQLVPGELRGAPSLREALGEIDRRLAEGPLVVHHAAIDVAFLAAAHARLGLRMPPVEVIDTAELLLRLAHAERFRAPHALDADPVLGLAEARARLGLPAYPAHDALADAVACGELLLALRPRLIGA